MSSSSEPEHDDAKAEWDAIEASMGPEPPPNGVPAPEPPPEIKTAELVAQVLGPGFALLAPAWRVSQDEIEALSEAYGAVIDKYFPAGLGAFGVEISAALATLAVIGPRLAMPRKAAPPPAQASLDQADPGQVPPAQPGESKSMLEG